MEMSPGILIAAGVLLALLAQCYRDQGVTVLSRRMEAAAICAKLSDTKEAYRECLKGEVR